MPCPSLSVFSEKCHMRNKSVVITRHVIDLAFVREKFREREMQMTQHVCLKRRVCDDP